MSVARRVGWRALRDQADAHNRRHAWEVDGEDWDDLARYPYTNIKQRLYLVLSVTVVWWLQRTTVRPNTITLWYAAAGLIGGALMATGVPWAVLLGITAFFLKAVLDWSDGLLARVTGQLSEEGVVLDEWGALVGSYAFVAGVGGYVWRVSGDPVYVYVTMWALLGRAIDVRHVAYRLMVRKLDPPGDTTLPVCPPVTTPVALPAAGSWGDRARRLVTNALDDRARSVDLVCLGIVVEVMTGRLWITPVICWLYAIKFTIIFVAGVHVTTAGRLPTQLAARLPVTSRRGV